MAADATARVDPELRAGLAAYLAAWRPLPREGFGAFRDAFEAAASPPEPLPPGIAVEDVRVPAGPDGFGPRVRVYRPTGGTGPLPGLYFVHGGGMVVGTVEAYDAHVGVLVEALGCVAAAVDYRLAPEHPYPAPVEDCYAGLAWFAAHAVELGVDPQRIAVCGRSAGGGLAAGALLLARDRGGPRAALQVLVAPMLDDRGGTPSSTAFSGGVLWTAEDNKTGWRALLGDLYGRDDLPADAAPARASDLRGLPPTFVEVGELEIFRDEDVDYARRLLSAGVPTELHVYPGAYHSFDRTVPDAAISRLALHTRIEALRRAFRSG